MNSHKQTKRALLTSVMALVMCVVMLVGTTFAWFTDTATANVNTIKAGNLKVDMVDETGASLVGKTLSWQKADEGRSQEVLWEPGATYSLEAFQIVNKGNLALKYEITLNGVKGSAKLLEAIEFTAKINGSDVALNNLTGVLLPEGATPQEAGEVVEKTDLITISGTMKTSAGNEYQGLTIDGVSITVVATQYTYEYDSKDNQYDADAKAEINVNASNIQDYLDGKYGSIDGMTLVLAAGDYGQLELGRATKYAGSNTQYRIGSFDADPMTFDDFYAEKNNGKWSGMPYYIRSMSNVTLKAAEGASVTVAGVDMSSGHKYGSAERVVTDYVLDRTTTSTADSYHLAQKVNNITFDGITFTAMSNITTSQAETIINGFTFTGCTFDLGYMETTHSNAYIALRYYNENGNGNVSNLVVDKCAFKNCSQGVYTGKVVNVSVTNSTFNTTAHNAIAVQNSNEFNHGQVVITGNKFVKIGDRIIRFNNVGADTQITIKDNTATNSGDGDGEVIKATSLAAGIKYDISDNDWGDNTKVANPEFDDKVTP